MTTLRFTPEGRQPDEVRLITDLWKREPPRPLVRVGDGWELELGALPVTRLEYELELTFSDGSKEWRRDPKAPSADAPFGPKSVHVLDGYVAPAWLNLTAPRGHVETLELESATSGGVVRGQLWSHPALAPSEPAPLLIAHDGPELARFSSLLHFLEVGRVPKMRAALLAPRARNDEYSASPGYAAALAHELVPALTARVPCTSRVGLGASLGALAMLHAHRSHPELFDALVLQSGSFFQHELDVHERGFSFFGRIDAFVREVMATKPARAVSVALTCGTGEENLANNQAMSRVLGEQGYAVRFSTAADGHTWTCWRDTLEPAFTALLPL